MNELELIMTIDNQIKDKKLQYDIDRTVAKIFNLIISQH